MSVDALRYLLQCRGECEPLDYKENLQLTSPKQRADLTKDALAVKNIGGGYIVIGVTDKTWEPIGLPRPLPLDSKMLRDAIREASGVELDVDIVQPEVYVDGSSRRFALIYIRSTRKRSKLRIPTVVAKDYHPRESYGLRRGEIYARKIDSTIKISTQIELQEVLDTLEAQADYQALQAQESSPFAIEDGLYRLLGTSKMRLCCSVGPGI